MISPKICHCIHTFFRNYAPVSTPSSYCIGYSVIKDTVTSYFTKSTLCTGVWVCWKNTQGFKTQIYSLEWLINTKVSPAWLVGKRCRGPMQFSKENLDLWNSKINCISSLLQNLDLWSRTNRFSLSNFFCGWGRVECNTVHRNILHSSINRSVILHTP